MNLSRRETLQWMMAAAALPLVRWAPPAMATGHGTAPPFAVAAWPPVLPPPPTGPGYGRDPDLMAPKVPWSLTLSKAQRATVDLLGDLILPKDERSPGAGALGVGAFIDEWISAPYPVQREDRERVLGGLIWLDAQSRALHGSTFDKINAAHQASILDALMAEKPVPAMAKPVAFMDTLRYLFVLGFYSLPEGKADMGFIGDEPTHGDYPGPSAEALAHLSAMLEALSLAAPQP